MGAEERNPEPTAAELTRARGAPLLEALENRLPGSAERAGVATDLAAALAADAAPEADRALLREAARIQDVGKLYVPLELLGRRPAELSAADRRQLRAYPEHGHAVARGAGIPERACAWILHQREHWDGSGPGGLEETEIPLGSRIIAVTREYVDAPLAPDAAGRDPRELAITRLEELAGTILDPRLAQRAATLAAA